MTIPDLGIFRDNNYMSSDQAKMVRQLVRNLCSELRTEAVSLVDAFMFPDWVLDSQVLKVNEFYLFADWKL